MNRKNLLAFALASPVAFSAARSQALPPDDYRQMQVGRGELILDPDIPIIDAHHHLFDRPGLRYMIDDYLEWAMGASSLFAASIQQRT
jgi:L-fuconolactonase